MFFSVKKKIFKPKKIFKQNYLIEKIDKNFLIVPYFRYFNDVSYFIKKNILHVRYLRYISRFKKANSFINYRLKRVHLLFLKKKKKIMWSLFNLYNLIYQQFLFDFFYSLKLIKKKKSMNYLIFSFHKNKLYLNLLNFNKKTFLFLSSGLFIKFFEKKKSFKKNKIIKVLMAKYLRKVFILTKINNFIFFIKKIPVFLLEIINFLNQPIIHKFLNPCTNKIVDETSSKLYYLKILNIIFLNNKSFGLNKSKKKGRIKRKIIRKVILSNKLID